MIIWKSKERPWPEDHSSRKFYDRDRYIVELGTRPYDLFVCHERQNHSIETNDWTPAMPSTEVGLTLKFWTQFGYNHSYYDGDHYNFQFLFFYFYAYR